MDEKQKSIKPARVELNIAEVLETIIKMTVVSVEPSQEGLFAPNSVEHAAETLFMGIIEGIRQKLTESDFRAYFVNRFITETDLYKLTDLKKLEEAIEERKKGSSIILPPNQFKH